ncbi:cell wall-binding repeat-containing protein [Raoultibacter timonensis]|uniref:cell wall-binding repeat-containing protein n=1 Tax=Raoultibacter timonensis TaxID=1907662 RepID=UPI0015E19C68|nr:cell wall-binding repeat-containing protein [Raoultibacter timonensis]
MVLTETSRPKKVLACLLSLTLAFGMVPYAYADDGEPVDSQGLPANEATGENAGAPTDDSAQDSVQDDKAASSDDAPEGLSEETESSEIADSNFEQTGDYASAITSEEIEEALAALDGGSVSALSLDSSDGVEVLAAGDTSVALFSGSDRYDTAAKQAVYGWSASKSEYVIVAGSNGWPDALAASSLAGALECPVLLTPADSLASSTSDAIAQIGASKVIIVGGEPTVSANVKKQLEGKGLAVERLEGADRFGTQLAIYQYGIDNNLWDGSRYVAATSGYYFTDALSFAPAAYKQKIPIFLTTEAGGFTEAQERALGNAAKTKSNLFANAPILLGGTNRVSTATAAYLKGVSASAVGGAASTTRLEGADRYDTSSKIATWAVSNAGCTWNGAAFATGTSPNDALGGGALQGKDGSVLLLVDSASYNPCLNALLPSKGSVTSLKFFGGTPSVSTEVRNQIISSLDDVSISYTDYAIGLDRLTSLEYSATKPYNGSLTTSEVRSALDPATSMYGTSSFLQFAVLSDGYSGMSAAQLDAFIASRVGYSERAYGVTSKLRNTGAYFIAAAKKYNINEVYLVCHAALESGWGCSKLAQGTVSGYSGYLNFYGIGAYDIDPNNGGAALAKSKGWTTPEKAILGAAEWIKNNYVNPTVSSAGVSGAQNTLYKMKWDVKRAVSSSQVWHQYATDIYWPSSIARIMSEFYSYSNVSLKDSGLRYEVPRYQ